MGQAGVGKTTLALRYLELARKQGMTVARASATRASQALPFGALAPVLPPGPDGDDLGRENQTELLRRYGRAVAETAGGRPLVVFVDDAHLLDGGSATLVHQLALTGKATVLLTVQSGQTVPDPVVALWKDALAERIEVAVLPDAARWTRRHCVSWPITAGAIRWSCVSWSSGRWTAAHWPPTAASGGCAVSCGSRPAWSSWSRCGSGT